MDVHDHGRLATFEVLAEKALAWTLATAGIDGEEVRAAFLEAYAALSPHLDAEACLRELRAMGIPAAVLSNGSQQALERVLAGSGLGPLLGEVISVLGKAERPLQGAIAALAPRRRRKCAVHVPNSVMSGQVRSVRGFEFRRELPTCHNPAMTPPPASPLVTGPVIHLPGHHGKVRRDGYRT